MQVQFELKCVSIENIPSSPSVKVIAHPQSLVDSDIFLEALYVIGTKVANIIHDLELNSSPERVKGHAFGFGCLRYCA